jgi:hypothetical protein
MHTLFFYGNTRFLAVAKQIYDLGAQARHPHASLRGQGGER